MTAKTPVYQLEYIVEGESARNARGALERNAKSIEAALITGGIAPPNTTDLLAAIARIAALEGAAPVAVPFINLTGAATGWSNFAYPGFARLRVWRSGRTVHLVGVVKNAAAMASGTQSQAARIPLGFRPPTDETPMISSFAAGAQIFRFDVTPDGLILAVNNGATTVAAGAFIPLNATWSLD